jgi:hypothetical protein
MLVIKAVLRTMNIDVDKCYQMIGSDVDQLTRLVRDFRRIYLETMNEEVLTWAT